MHLSILAKDAVCHVRGKKGTMRRTVGIKLTKRVGKERKARKARKAKGKKQNPRMVTPRRKVLPITVERLVTLFVNVQRRKSQKMQASSSGGGDVHCLPYTDDQPHWIMMLAEVGQSREQSNNVKFLVDCGAACHAWPCKTKPGSSRGGTFLAATGAPVASQGTLEATFQLVDVHDVTITLKAMFELLPVRRPILSVSRLVDKGFAVVMGNEQGNTLGKDGRVKYLHKSSGVYHVRATALSELCPLEDQDPRNDDAPPAEAVGEATVPWTRRLPYKPTEDERMAHSVSHLPFRGWFSHCVTGLARDWPHRSDCGPPPDIPMVAMDFCFVNTESDDDVLTILAMKEKPFQSVGASVLPEKPASEFAVATIIGHLDVWGHQEVMIKCDQEQSMKRIAELLQERRRPRRNDR